LWKRGWGLGVVLLVYAVDLGGLSGSDTQRKRGGGTPNPIRGDGGTVGRGWLEI